jgi:hypothetical protein
MIPQSPNRLIVPLPKWFAAPAANQATGRVTRGSSWMLIPSIRPKTIQQSMINSAMEMTCSIAVLKAAAAS